MAGDLNLDRPPGEVPFLFPSTIDTVFSTINTPNANSQPIPTPNLPSPSKTSIGASHCFTTSSPSLKIRQNADCSNSITAAVEAATVALSRSFQQELATASQALQQASISASAALQAVSASASNVIAAVVGSSSSAVAAASTQVMSLSSVASAANASLLLVQQRASSIEVSQLWMLGMGDCVDS
jgi:hypothetical protein